MKLGSSDMRPIDQAEMVLQGAKPRWHPKRAWVMGLPHIEVKGICSNTSFPSLLVWSTDNCSLILLSEEYLSYT